ncbi:MAG: 16S rRNA (cytidine(1402)-2'-O)-methyltransferase [Anaerolineae bacterium]|nr:16S rRNA (cytidine(1402)-2'-O)-methyltransferase [Anaerolineae bacterium]MCB0206124.1 16S rRNA (cytidine(1402)-2'-O)-methyltransferase [Anaerolineae bacterium]MCB0253261.1 16S rRNA (cytidine(1402)-2'-O)-methyltransferase [Anaerolineae bacterium]
MSTLYVVGTPIGNLEDMTDRARRVLAEVDLIAAEDTRVTRQLLTRFDIHTEMTTYTDAYYRKKAERLGEVLGALERGRTVALVSDAGMPGLSDPGFELVDAAITAGHEIVVIPGPSAITAALVVSGLPTERFLFLGFLPRKSGERRAALAEVADEPATLVLFESPHRVIDALEDMLAVLGDRRVAAGRELTKRYEEIWRGTVSEAIEHFRSTPVRGEVTLVVAGTGRRRAEGRWPEAQVRVAVELLAHERVGTSGIARAVSRLSGWTRAEIYELAVEAAGEERAEQ